MSASTNVSPLRLGLCGLGTVGQATLRLLAENADLLARRAGRPIEIRVLGMRSDKPGLETGAARIERDILAVASADDVDVVVELIGGTDTAAHLVNQALAHGKHVVTANKALIAAAGGRLAEIAAVARRALCFEAAVAGGIPILQALRTGLGGNRLDSLVGIINGTTNFMLTEIEASGRAYDDVLAQAQALGYAEADPTFDVGGIDAAQKLAIAASIGFGFALPDQDGVYVEGIEELTPADTGFAAELGYRIKHLGIAQRRDDGVELRVHPVLLPLDHPLARVDGVTNAVVVRGNAVGEAVFIGPGAGGEATASAVISDILAIARADDGAGVIPDRIEACSPFAMKQDRLEPLRSVPMGEVVGSFYLRLQVRDEPGMLAAIAQALAEQGVSLDSVIQRPPAPGSAAAALGADGLPLVLLTHKVREAQIDAALGRLRALPGILGEVVRLRLADSIGG